MTWWFISLGSGVAIIGYLALLLLEDRHGERLLARGVRAQLDHLFDELSFRLLVTHRRMRQQKLSFPYVAQLARSQKRERKQPRLHVVGEVNDSALGQMLQHKETTKLTERQRKKTLTKALEGRNR